MQLLSSVYNADEKTVCNIDFAMNPPDELVVREPSKIFTLNHAFFLLKPLLEKRFGISFVDFKEHLYLISLWLRGIKTYYVNLRHNA